MSVYKLRKVEVAYELRIRGIDSSGTANDLRKRLSKALSSDTPVDETAVKALKFDDEFKECSEILSDLKILLQHYDGDFNDDEFHRIVARLGHLYPRVGRIPIPATPKDGDDSLKKTTLLHTQVKKLIEYVKTKTPQPENDEVAVTAQAVQTTSGMETNLHKSDVDNKPTSPDITLAIQSVSLAQTNPNHVDMTQRSSLESFCPPNLTTLGIKAAPVYKWRLTFDGQGNQSIGAFLERVEEIRRARGVTEQELFQSAVDLFTGQALIWFRSTAGRVNTWSELCKEMRIVF